MWIFALVSQFETFSTIIVASAGGRISEDGWIAADGVVAKGVAPRALLLPHGLVIDVGRALDGAFDLVVAFAVVPNNRLAHSIVVIMVMSGINKSG